MSARITWRKQPSEKGLAAIVQAKRGYDLCVGGEAVIYVRPYTKGFDKYTVLGWYFYGDGVNTWATPNETIEACKEAAKKYYLAHAEERTHDAE